jgi:hypothetical protein
MPASMQAPDSLQRVLTFVREPREPLFAVYDAARSPQVLELLKTAQEKQQSLLEGAKGEALGPWAPYLVALPPGSALLETLVQEGWGKAWGIYFTCPLPFEEVRKHLRHFLTVRDEENVDCFFRFYDPRVLRAFLPVCTREELRTFFGPIRRFKMEGRPRQVLLDFSLRPSGDLHMRKEE